MELLRVVEGEDVTANLAPTKKRKKMASDTPHEAPKRNPALLAGNERMAFDCLLSSFHDSFSSNLLFLVAILQILPILTVIDHFSYWIIF
jgi:hypothetical protein